MKILVADTDFLKKIPNNPGVYRFYAICHQQRGCESPSEALLYIGKALNLRKRVKSYFQKSTTLSPRISIMVRKIDRIEITVTENEASALILENNLIKSLKPKYNIIFRDDKTYPLIRISNDDFPRIDSYRGKPESNRRYFGPYPNVQALRHSLDLIQRLFKIRTCSDTMFKNRSRPCMLYQINRCTAPCVSFVSKTDYQKQIDLVIEFLKGNYKEIINQLTKRMTDFAGSEDFEAAANIRDEIGLIKSMATKQIINDYKRPINTDIVIVKDAINKIFIYVIMVRGGVYVSDNNFVVDNPDNNLADAFGVFLENYYFTQIAEVSYSQNANSLINPLNSHLRVNDKDIRGNNILEIHTKVEVGSETRKFLAGKLNIKNSFSPNLNNLYHMGVDNLTRIIARNITNESLGESASHLAQILQIEKIERIECIDVSHNQGQNTVASIVVYENGKMNNSLYKRYNLSVDNDGNKINGNDLLAFKIVLSKRLTNTETKLPDIIVVDGGVNQLNVARDILHEYKLDEVVKLLAVFKGEHRDPMRDSVILPSRRVIKALENIKLFKLLHTLRDEAHRFAITGHRKKEAKRMSSSTLDDIPNIGMRKKQELIAHFGSAKNVANASINDLEDVAGIGNTLARQIYEYFHGE